MWESFFCDWSFCLSKGASRDLLFIWCNAKGKTILGFALIGVWVLICVLWWMFMLSVSWKGRERVWEHLILTRERFQGVARCVMWDFNSFLRPTERKWVSQESQVFGLTKSLEFGTFIKAMGLVELKLLSMMFTWFHSNGVSLSRLDRVLRSSGWEDVWGQGSL